VRLFLLALVLTCVQIALPQSVNTAKKIYDSSQESVFLVYLNDSGGSPTGQGTAFQVAPRLLVTNAHVAKAGTPVLAVGPVRIPVRIVRLDETNDLALLAVDVDLTSRPLPLSNDQVSPGEPIFAIGNPEGLEKTISEGIVSGIRKEDGKDLIQITSAISHGSSGGPIFNTKGEVVGVTVAILEEGQNLNFAVPVAYVQTLLARKDSPQPKAQSAAEFLREASELLTQQKNETYSSEPKSPYRQETRKIVGLLEEAVDAGAGRDLHEAACIGGNHALLIDVGIAAARKLVMSAPVAENYSLLAFILLEKAEIADRATMTLQAGSQSSDQPPEQAKLRDQANQMRDETNRLIGEAHAMAVKSPQMPNGSRDLVAMYVEASADEYNKQYAHAIPLLTILAEKEVTACGRDLMPDLYYRLITENEELGRHDESEKWFRRYAARYEPSADDWGDEAERRSIVGDHDLAADAYERAASGAEDRIYLYCSAAMENYFKAKMDGDKVMVDGRKCIDASVRVTDAKSRSLFKERLPDVYQWMATVLESRGVFDQALTFIQDSLNARPDDPRALYEESIILSNLHRYSECISAASAAIRLSDGKYPYMHFEAGSCYYATNAWSQAETHFRMAAEANKTDAVSAFNLGLSLFNQGFTMDANRWFKEALNRRPDAELRDQILSELKQVQ